MNVVGWTKPERVSFPSTLDDRTCYRVVDIADHFIQPLYFGTKTVEFRIGSELRALNVLLSTVRFIKQTLRIPTGWLIPLGRAIIRAAAPFGSSAGGVMVEITGYAGEECRSETWCVFSGNSGERIPAIPAAIAANMVLRKAIRGAGIVPLPDWITRDQLVAEFAGRDIRVVVRSGAGEWRAVGDTTNC